MSKPPEPKKKTAVQELRERYKALREKNRPSQEILDQFIKKSPEQKPAEEPIRKIAKRRTPEAEI